ncbi:MAG: hypothetical protein GY818_06535, partial [Planctomycetaceae bacterium]|nr:hypothetical protein [Planctomycetaceae bacterium]
LGLPSLGLPSLGLPSLGLPSLGLPSFAVSASSEPEISFFSDSVCFRISNCSSATPSNARKPAFDFASVFSITSVCLPIRFSNFLIWASKFLIVLSFSAIFSVSLV